MSIKSKVYLNRERKATEKKNVQNPFIHIEDKKDVINPFIHIMYEADAGTLYDLNGYSPPDEQSVFARDGTYTSGCDGGVSLEDSVYAKPSDEEPRQFFENRTNAPEPEVFAMQNRMVTAKESLDRILSAPQNKKKKEREVAYLDLVDSFIASYSVIRTVSGYYQLKRFAFHGISVETFEVLVQNHVKIILGSEMTPNIVKGTIFLLSNDVRIYRDNFQWNNHWVAFNNGLLNVYTREFTTNPSGIYCKHFINCTYISSISSLEAAPNFLKVITTAGNNDYVLTMRVLQVFTTWLTPVKIKRIFYIYGVADSGKSMLLALLRNLLGKLVTPFTLQSIGGDFGLEPLNGKSLALCDDASSATWNSNVIGLMKSLVSEDGALDHNRKHKSYAELENSSLKMVIASNYPPNFSGYDDGIATRLTPIVMTTAVPKDQQISGLSKMLMAEADQFVSYCFNQILPFLISSNFAFSGYAETNELLEDTKKILSLEDAVEAFFCDCIVDSIGTFTPTAVLHDEFCRYHRNTPVANVDLKVFSAKLSNILGKSVRRSYQGRNLHGYPNIAVK